MDNFDKSLKSYDVATAAGDIYAVGSTGLSKRLAFDASAVSNLKGQTNGIGYVTGAGSTGTEASNTVTVDALCGTITTSSLTTAAAGEYVITVTCSKCAATDVPIVAIKANAGNGTPAAVVTAVSAGSFVITLTNLHASAAFNSAMTLNYAIFKGVAA